MDIRLRSKPGPGSAVASLEAVTAQTRNEIRRLCEIANVRFGLEQVRRQTMCTGVSSILAYSLTRLQPAECQVIPVAAVQNRAGPDMPLRWDQTLYKHQAHSAVVAVLSSSFFSFSFSYSTLSVTLQTQADAAYRERNGNVFLEVGLARYDVDKFGLATPPIRISPPLTTGR
jgi:hypothetical protein